MNKIDFKTSGYFSWHILFAGVFFVIIGLALLPINLVAALILFLICLVIYTTHYRLSIELQNKIFHDYLWILGFKVGEKKKFDSMEYLFIKNSNVSQTMNLRVASSTIQKEVFDGYLKFSGNEKIHLLTLDSKESLIKRMKSFANQLKIKVIDYSAGEPKEM